MKSKINEFIDKSIEAMLSAIEIYNKPSFKYREESFAILSINSWELLLKAKWLSENRNKITSLYAVENIQLKSGEKGKRKVYKTTRCGNPLTHSMDFIYKKLLEQKKIDKNIVLNIEALMEVRDSSIHFVNESIAFSRRIQEISTATVKNYVDIIKIWFARNLSDCNFFLLPLSFIEISDYKSIILNTEERNMVQYLDKIDEEHDEKSQYPVSISIEFNFVKSKTSEGLKYIYSNDPDATKINLTDEEFKSRWPYTYRELTQILKDRYNDFKENEKYHEIRKRCIDDVRFAKKRFLDPSNPKSSSQYFFSSGILNVFDKEYLRK